MRTDLDHLPAGKQRELERVVQILFEEFDEARSLATQDWKKKGRVQKIILYGSYARGGWVDEPHTAKGYQSDFDLLIIVNDKRLTDRVEYWAQGRGAAEPRARDHEDFEDPANFIVHTLHEVNDGLAHGRFFFIDVARDGIALYQSDDSELAEPRPKTPDQALAMAKEYFEEWMPTAVQCSETAKIAIAPREPKAAAFRLHQDDRMPLSLRAARSAPSTRHTSTISASCALRPSGSIVD